jgi:ribonuclease R
MAEAERLRERVLELMRAPEYRPRNKGEMARELELHADQRAELRAELARMEREGTIVRGKKARYKLREREGNLLSGTIRFQVKGDAWFYPDLRDEANQATGIDLERFRRFYVGSRKTSVALDGDRVALRVERLGPPVWWKHAKHKRAALELPGAEDQATGRVERILQRRSGVVVGTLMERKGFVYVQPDDESLPASIELEDAAGGTSGQKVAVRLLEWESRQVTPRGEIVEVLGWPDEPGVDIRGIIHRHGLREEFPAGVEEEAKSVPLQVPPEALEDRRDWRDELVITIDPVDAKDFDDAIWIRERERGWEMGVHIADVAHYVKPDSALDREARERGNSTYLVDRVLPMLPEALSNGICSLVDRRPVSPTRRRRICWRVRPG